MGTMVLAMTSVDVARAEPTPGAAAAAQALFEEGTRLLQAGQATDACPKLEESQRLDPAPGTLFHLSDCYERTGRTASAWAGFLAVAGAARAAGREQHEAAARKRASALEPRLVRLTIVVRAAASGLQLTRNGEVIGRGSWDAAVPIDPGRHTIRATAPGRRAWVTTVDTRSEAPAFTVEVPPLPRDAAPATAPPPPRDGDGSDGSVHRTVGIVAAGVGVVGIGIGSFLGLRAISLNDDAGPHCPGDNLCTEDGVALRDQAFDTGTASTVAFAVAVPLLAAGVVLWVTAPRRAPRTTGGVAISAHRPTLSW
jgi:hypothetical protein